MKASMHLVLELYNQGDGFYPRVMSAEAFPTRRGARMAARSLAKRLLESYNVQVTDGLGEADNRFDDVWIPVRDGCDWGFDAVEKTINRDIRVVEVAFGREKKEAENG